MELSSVSPPAASPTEGADLCEIDVTNVAINSVTLLICLCGLAGNGAVLCLLRWKCSNAGIHSLAVADFLFLLFVFPSSLLFLQEDMSCSLIMPLVYVSFLFQLPVVPYYSALLLLIAVSGQNDMKKLCKLCCRCVLPDPMMWVLWGTQLLAYFALFIAILMVTSLCPAHEHCQSLLISNFILLLCVAPMVISRTIEIVKAQHSSQQQQPKRRDIVISLAALFTLLLSLCNVLQQLSYTDVSSKVVFLLTCLQSTIKPFVYFLVGSCWRPCSVRSLRESLQRVFEE